MGPQTGVPQGPVPQAVLANTQVPAPTPQQQQQQQQDYMSPVLGMTPQVTPSKSDYGDYSVASGLPMMSTAPPGVTSSAGKKTNGLPRSAAAYDRLGWTWGPCFCSQKHEPVLGQKVG